jgi:uncharacterized protein YggE
MNTAIKNILGWAIVLAVLAIGYAAWSAANSYSQSIQPSSFRSFSVTGQGKATAIPDVAEFSFEVITQGGTDLTSLQSQNTTAANKAIAFVQSEGVPSSDIQTNYYDVSPNYQSYNCSVIPVYASPAGTSASMPIVRPCPPASIVGYTVTQSVDVKIHDFTKVGDILGSVVTNGANQVGALSFTLDDPTTVQNEARADAIAKAKIEAQAMAQAGGFKLGRLLNITEGGAYNPSPVYNAEAGVGTMALAAPAAAPSIQPGSEEVDMTETLQYEIQ